MTTTTNTTTNTYNTGDTTMTTETTTTETDITPNEFLHAKFATFLVERLEGGVELDYVDYRDHLSPSDVAELLEDDDFPEFLNRIEEGYWEQRYDAAMHVLNDTIAEFIVDAEFDDELWVDNRQLKYELLGEYDYRFMVQEANQSNLLGDLLANTPQMLWQYKIGNMGHDGVGLGVTGTYEWTSAEDAVADLMGMLKSPKGFWTVGEAARLEEALMDILAECGDGFGNITARPVFLVHKSPETIVELARREHWGTHPEIATGQGQVTFTDPHLVLLDPWSGSGMDGQLTGSFVVPWDVDRITLDSEAPGYGWDEVAGVSTAAYDTPMEVGWSHQDNLGRFTYTIIVN